MTRGIDRRVRALLAGLIVFFAFLFTTLAVRAEEPTKPQSMLAAYFLDVGQGDCTVIVCDGEAMIIDAGDNSKGTLVQWNLNKLGITNLKYAIGTHPDADHIGGMDVIIYKFPVGTYIMNPSADTGASYRDVVDNLGIKGYQMTPATVGSVYTLGGATFEIIGPRKPYGDDNNESIVLKLTHGVNTFLFTGDAEALAETDLVLSGADLAADVLKVGHHGSSSSTSKAFLDAVAPKYAVISCKTGNSYGHPHVETLRALQAKGCAFYRTDEQGTVAAVSNGQAIGWTSVASVTWAPGVQIVVPSTTQAVSQGLTDAQYVLNRNSKKFHHYYCDSVLDMSEKNKIFSNENRNDIISKGYVPCKRCHP